MKIIPSLNIAPLDLLNLWSDLEQCYYQDNGYGGDTAELYAYRFQRRQPMLEAYKKGQKIYDETQEEIAREAALNLYALLETFAGLRNVRIMVDEREFGEWVAHTPFVHRVHVKIIPKGESA